MLSQVTYLSVRFSTALASTALFQSSSLLMLPRPPFSTLFPYTTLFRSHQEPLRRPHLHHARPGATRTLRAPQAQTDSAGIQGDRKSTRLNSSHVEISYAVFCLKKKNNHYGLNRRGVQCCDEYGRVDGYG